MSGKVGVQRRVRLEGRDDGSVRVITAGTYAARCYREEKARAIAANQQAQIFRTTDPVERAKTFLRRRGWTVFSASVVDGPPDQYVVGRNRKTMTGKELIAYAMARGHE